MKEKIKSIINNYYFRHFVIIMGMLFSFLILDVGIRYFSNKYVLIYKYTHASPLFFSISWASLFIGLIYLLNKKGRMIAYPIIVGIFNILTLAQILYMKSLNRFFGLSDIFYAGEGKDYFLYALAKTDLFTIVLLLLSIGTCVVTCLIMKHSEYRKKNVYSYIIILCITTMIFCGFRFSAINRLGKPDDISTWAAAYNVRNIYNDFNSQSKNMEVAGLYEQTFRNSFLYIREMVRSDKEELSEMVFNELSEEENTYTENEYTGIFKDKNLILVLMESIDSFLVTDEIMPTLSKLRSEGWDFTNKYSPPFGGGQTINSEFAINTGLYAIDNSKAIYNYENIYPYSVPSLFKESGYLVNSFHENSGKFYNRSNFHRHLGYENHYALQDMKDIDHSLDYTLDSNIMKNKELYNYIAHDEKFMTYVITYSAHLPYNSTNQNCSVSYGLEVEGNTALSCIQNLGHDTDEFIRMLIERLEKEGHLDDTVIAFVTDHYAYGFEDVRYIKDFKNVNDLYMIQNTPFIIWSKDIKHKKIDTLMDTADIAPTLLNLFGIKYDSRNYVGQDVFYEDRDDFVYFTHGLFYDGDLFYDSGNKVTDENREYINNMILKVNGIMERNKNMIFSNYFYYQK